MQKIETYIRLIENTIARQDLDNEPAELYEPLSYILHLGGKRIRPALTLAACELFDGSTEDAILPALGIEVFHNFSLIHDDIMDQAPVRRGKPTVHKKWNENIAILSGDLMLVKAYQYISKADPKVLPAVLETFSKAAVEVCEGQQYDMNFEQKAEVSEDDYLEMIRLKTSVLLGCALKIGALIAKASAKDADAIYKFGESLGMAFQMQDDLLDAFGDMSKVGKQAGGDILSDKKTLLMIRAMQQTDELKNWFGRKDADKVNAVRRIFINSGARDYVSRKMNYYYDLALENLQMINGNAEIKEELNSLATYLVKREQ